MPSWMSHWSDEFYGRQRAGVGEGVDDVEEGVGEEVVVG